MFLHCRPSCCLCWHKSRRRPEGHHNICSNICSKHAQVLTKNVLKNMLNYILKYPSNCPSNYTFKFIHSQSRQDIVQVHCICIAISRCPEGVLTRGRRSPKGRPHTKVLSQKKESLCTFQRSRFFQPLMSFNKSYLTQTSQHKPRLVA